MKTMCQREGEKTYFVVYDLDPVAREGANYLGCVPYKDGLARAYPSNTPRLDGLYQQFARAAEAMILQRAGVQPVPWEEALQSLLLRMEGQNISWWLAGSCALAARGLDIAPGDLDLVTDEAGSQRLAEILSDVLIGPVENASGWISHWFGRAFLHARIEWIGGPVATADEHGITEFGPAATSSLETIRWRDYTLRVPPLEIQLAVNERRGMADRVEKIKRAMSLRNS